MDTQQQQMIAQEQSNLALAGTVSKVELPTGHISFERTEFDAEYEAFARTITNPDGQHNSAYDRAKWDQMPVQDRLVRVWGWFHGNTGFSCMFLWASGRQDAHVVLDNPVASKQAKAKQRATIEAFQKGKAHVTVH